MEGWAGAPGSGEASGERRFRFPVSGSGCSESESVSTFSFPSSSFLLAVIVMKWIRISYSAEPAGGGACSVFLRRWTRVRSGFLLMRNVPGCSGFSGETHRRTPHRTNPAGIWTRTLLV